MIEKSMMPHGRFARQEIVQVINNGNRHGSVNDSREVSV